MKTLNTLILSILCTTASLHSSTHQELLHYDLSQRKATQKLVKTIRNVTGITSLLGLISFIYLGKQHGKLMNNALERLNHIDKNAGALHFEVSSPLPFYLRLPIGLSALGFFPSLAAFVASALYSAYNNLQIEALEAELNKPIHTK